jgi:hypothetical protein
MDPRRNQWNRWEDDELSTRHSHGSYPKVDDYSFYYSYHSLVMVAGKLLKEVPVIYSLEDYAEPWQYWLRRHLPTRNDGKWVADRRDPAPSKRRGWVHLSDAGHRQNWQWEVATNDFQEVLLEHVHSSGQICVWADWSDTMGEHTESILVRSALAKPEDALAGC